MTLFRTTLSSLVLLGTFLVATTQSGQAAGLTTPAPCPATMAGTFLPPSWASSWSLSRFAQDIDSMNGVGINTVILQDSIDLDAKVAYFPNPPAGYPSGPNVAGDVIQEAAIHHTKVVLGLANSNTWATNAGNQAWLANDLRTDESLADDLYASYHGSFAGWYIPNEVDDYLLATPSEVTPTTWFFNSLAGYLHTHDGDLTVMASPFFQNTWQTASQFADGVRHMFADVDIVNLQDGAGEGRSAPAVTSLFGAVAAALSGSRIQLWDDPDMYLMGVGPMPPGHLQSDLQATCSLARQWTGFAYSTQMDPVGVGTSYYYDAYRSYFQNGG
jgi:hypothetical protein